MGTFQVSQHIKVLQQGCTQRGHGGSTPFLPYITLCVSSTWLLLSCIFYNKPVTPS